MHSTAISARCAQDSSGVMCSSAVVSTSPSTVPSTRNSPKLKVAAKSGRSTIAAVIGNQ